MSFPQMQHHLLSRLSAFLPSPFFFFNSPSPAGVAMAQLGAGRPKSLLQGIINSGVSQGRAVFIKLRQLNAVAA